MLPLSFLPSPSYYSNLPTTISPGPITADFISPSLDQSDLDAPKLSRANTSSFGWWHFDAIATEDTNASVAITFSNSGRTGFPLSFPPANSTSSSSSPVNVESEGDENYALWAYLALSFPDGRIFRHTQKAESARLHGSGDSSVAIWHAVGGWMGSEEGYEVEIGMVQPQNNVNVSGRISMERITNSHSLCSSKTNFSSSLALGSTSNGLGWIGILPDAVAVVDILVNGERLGFEGYEFHDKIWSSKPFTTSTKSLTRGRAHLGLHSLLWLSYTPVGSNAEQVVSSFLSRDGETVSSGCEAGSVSINPGTEETEGGLVSGFQIGFPGARASVARDVEILDGGGNGGAGGNGQGQEKGNGHVRWVGRARGTVEGVDEEGGRGF
ncbi:hypothetical protein BDW74DRAFT_185587 [Aspergillus multicolor]|uniref:uncharacterized protein n=1 Tax=Aspergillus multicolor TaxID=41759 RepID=UPI003CCD3A17